MKESRHSISAPATRGRSFSSGHVHDVRNESDRPALSLHAYSPRLTTMTRYVLENGRLVTTGTEQEGEAW